MKVFSVFGLLAVLTLGCHQLPTSFSGHSGGMGEYSQMDKETIQQWQDAAAQGKGAQSVLPKQILSPNDEPVHRDGRLRLRTDLFSKKESKEKNIDSSDSENSESGKKEKKGFSLNFRSDPLPDSPDIKGLTAPSASSSSSQNGSTLSKQFGKIVPISSSKPKSLLADSKPISSKSFSSRTSKNNDMPAEMASLEERFPDFIVTLGGEPYSASVNVKRNDSALEEHLLTEVQSNPPAKSKTNTSLLFPEYEIAEKRVHSSPAPSQEVLPEPPETDDINEEGEGFAYSDSLEIVSQSAAPEAPDQERMPLLVGYSFMDFNKDSNLDHSFTQSPPISPAVSFTANFPAFNSEGNYNYNEGIEELLESQKTDVSDSSSEALPSPKLPSPLNVLTDVVPGANIFKSKNIEKTKEENDPANEWKEPALDAIALLQKKMAKQALTGEIYPEDQARLQLLLLATCDVVTTEDILANFSAPYKDLCKEQYQNLENLIFDPSSKDSILKASFNQILPPVLAPKKKEDADESIQEQEESLSVTKSLFVKKAAPFGLYEKIDGEYAAGDSVAVYYELDNVSFNETDDEAYQMDILCRRDLLDSEGKAVLETQERLCSSRSFSVLRDIVLNLAVDLPTDLEPGDYTLKIVLLDKNKSNAAPVTNTMTLKVMP